MAAQDIRWKQRFRNFDKAMGYLEIGMAIKNPDAIQQAGLIQFFEMSFELSWNMMKDYLEEQGFADVKFPRDVIKKAFETEMIADGHKWLELLNDRNLTSHTYDEKMAEQVVLIIREKYYSLLKQLHDNFRQK